MKYHAFVNFEKAAKFEIVVCCKLKVALYELIHVVIIPHVNSPYKTSIDERLIFYNITRCYSDGEYCHLFAIAAGDIIKYQGGHMMRNADARTVRSR